MTVRERPDIITTTPDGENYCCWELRQLAPTYGDGTLTHSSDYYWFGDEQQYNPHSIWYLRFFDNAWDDQVVFKHKQINFCPFCGTKIPIIKKKSPVSTNE
jgi:hypothetical protein